MTKAVAVDIFFLGYTYVQSTARITAVSRPLFPAKTAGAASVDYFRHSNVGFKSEVDITAMALSAMFISVGQNHLLKSRGILLPENIAMQHLVTGCYNIYKQAAIMK